jgi:hypothetical protein
MAREDEARVEGFPRLFQVDPSWYETAWLHEPAPRKAGLFAFLRRAFSQLRLTSRQVARAERLRHIRTQSPNEASPPVFRSKSLTVG